MGRTSVERTLLRVNTSYRSAHLGGAQMGDIASDVAQKIVIAITPQLKELTASAAEAAKPVISQIVREDVVPGVAPYIVIGFIGLGAVAAVIGALMARKCKTS
jgi:hypothetical protein